MAVKGYPANEIYEELTQSEQVILEFSLLKARHYWQALAEGSAEEMAQEKIEKMSQNMAEIMHTTDIHIPQIIRIMEMPVNAIEELLRIS